MPNLPDEMQEAGIPYDLDPGWRGIAIRIRATRIMPPARPVEVEWQILVK